MKLFTKLALVSAIAVSGSAMAMESLDDSAMSATTGQDGISLGIGISRIEIAKMYIHDNDGLDSSKTFNVTKANPAFNDAAQATYNQTYPAAYAAYVTANPTATAAAAAAAAAGTAQAAAEVVQSTFVNNTAPTLAAPTNLGGTGDSGVTANKGAGAIVVNGVQLTANANDLLTSHNLADVTIDTDGNNGNGAFLNIGAEVSGLNIKVGSIGVAQSGTRLTVAGGNSLAARRGITGPEATILSNLNLVTGRMDANIQLGNTPQGAMIALSGTMTGGLAINGLNIHDNAGGGRIVIDGIKVSDAGTSNDNLSMDAKISVKPAGLEIIGGGNATDVYVKGIHLDGSLTGSTWAAGKSIGDIEINGMQMFHGDSGMIPGAKITVRGH